MELNVLEFLFKIQEAGWISFDVPSLDSTMNPVTWTTNGGTINEFVLRNVEWSSSFFKALYNLSMGTIIMHDEQPQILCGK